MTPHNNVKIAWSGKHFGEEPPLVGDKGQGAGAIFFSGCDLHCVYCQNHQISQEGLGKYYSIEELAGIMLRLQAECAVNIDLVSPTIWWQQIKEAIVSAKAQGLRIPIVWNSNAYESIEIIKEMNGFADIYLPDYKYADNELALRYSQVKNYASRAFAAIKEMREQVGDFQVNENGIGKRGLIVRHLILPNNLENSRQALRKIAEISPEIYVSLMRQYAPIFRAMSYPELNRLLTEQEFENIFQYLLELNLNNGWVQEDDSSKILIPDFRKINPFA